MVVDWTGTAPQVKGAINNTLSFTKAASYIAIRSVLPADIPNNEGVFRAIEVIAPPGTIANGVLPAACAARGLTGFRMVDCASAASPRCCPIGCSPPPTAATPGSSIGGYHADRTPFIYVDFTCGAWGARPLADGPDGNANMCANMSSHSVEVTETEQPLRIVAYEFIPDRPVRQIPRRRAVSARLPVPRGGGRCCRCAPTAALPAVRPVRRRPRPAVVELSEPATARTAPLPSKFTMTIRRGDVFRHEIAGAGGWGDPLERDPARGRARRAQRVREPRGGARPTTAS